MSEFQPDKTDAILGGQNPPPFNAVVLGGVDGAKRKLAHELGLSDELAAELIQTHDIFSFETVTVNKHGDVIASSKKQAFYYTEDLGDGIALEMVYIPAGSFMMGSVVGEGSYWWTSGDPKQLVNIPAFHMGRYPITQEQYQAIIGQNPAYFNDFVKGYVNNNRRPVEQVFVGEAREFCSKLSQTTAKSYQLPNEVQWEYACRAGTTTPFYFGDTITPWIANYFGAPGCHKYADESFGIYRMQTTIVGIFPPNSFGLYDMHGNVFEWYEDSRSEKQNFTKGGAWNCHADQCCANLCHTQVQYVTQKQIKSHNIGFRVICL
jgi:formylglycine-generating enzyme required for sulfatase activity